MKLNSIIKNITPPILLSLVAKKKSEKGEYKFTGNFTSHLEAAAASTGYDDDKIINKVKDALLQVKNGTAIYERDAVLFDKIQYSWPLLAIFQNIAIRNNSCLSVLDFGGSLGSTYFQNLRFLKHLKQLEWKVVEQKKFVDTGRKYFQDDNLKFFYSIDEALESGSPDLLLLSGVLQYLPAPYELLNDVLKLDIKTLVFDRTSFIRGNEDRITIQHVSESIYPSSYPSTFFNENKFLKLMLSKYDLVSDFDSYAESGLRLKDGSKAYWKGFYFTRKSDTKDTEL